MDEALLLKELKAIIEESAKRGIKVFVIGAFCVKAYDCLLRESHDLDLAVAGDEFASLAQLLKDLGFFVHPKNIWVTAEKQIGEALVAVHIAVDEILDLNSQNSFPIRDEKKVFLKSDKVGFGIPALSLSGLLITKLISFRENDIVDVVSILMNRFDELSAQELYFKAEGSNNLLTIRRRLTELREFFESDEIDAIWYIRANRVLSAEEKAALLNKITKLLKPFTNFD
jgi:hypothetical protein